MSDYSLKSSSEITTHITENSEKKLQKSHTYPRRRHSENPYYPQTGGNLQNISEEIQSIGRNSEDYRYSQFLQGKDNSTQTMVNQQDTYVVDISTKDGKNSLNDLSTEKGPYIPAGSPREMLRRDLPPTLKEAARILEEKNGEGQDSLYPYIGDKPLESLSLRNMIDIYERIQEKARELLQRRRSLQRLDPDNIEIVVHSGEKPKKKDINKIDDSIEIIVEKTGEKVPLVQQVAEWPFNKERRGHRDVVTPLYRDTSRYYEAVRDYIAYPLYDKVRSMKDYVYQWWSSENPQNILARDYSDYPELPQGDSLSSLVLRGEIGEFKEQIAKIAARDIMKDLPGNDQDSLTKRQKRKVRSVIEERILDVFKGSDTASAFQICQYVENSQQLHAQTQEIKRWDRSNLNRYNEYRQNIKQLAEKVEELTRPEGFELLHTCIKYYQKGIVGNLQDKATGEKLSMLLKIADKKDQLDAASYSTEFSLIIIDKYAQQKQKGGSKVFHGDLQNQLLAIQILQQGFDNYLQDQRNQTNQEAFQQYFTKLEQRLMELPKAINKEAAGPWWKQALTIAARVIAVTADITIDARFGTDGFYKDAINPTHL